MCINSSRVGLGSRLGFAGGNTCGHYRQRQTLQCSVEKHQLTGIARRDSFAMDITMILLMSVGIFDWRYWILLKVSHEYGDRRCESIEHLPCEELHARRS